MSSLKKSYKPYFVIDTGEICDFIDDHRKEEKIDPELLKERPELKAFLKFSLLYFDDGTGLQPYRIKGYENDFCKAHIVNVNHQEIHRSFLSRIAFICNLDGTKTLCCHPCSVDTVEKVIVQIYLRSNFFVDQAVKVFTRLFENHRGDLQSGEKDETIRKKEFFKRYLNTAAKKSPDINSYLQNLAKNSQTVEQFYKYAVRMMLEKIDHPMNFGDFRITRLMTLIEHLEKVAEYPSYSWGKSASRKPEELYAVAASMCDFNPPATDTVVGRAYSYSTYYENYTDQKLHGHVYLTTHMDSLGLLGLFSENMWELEAPEWTKIGVHSITKKQKIQRHASYHSSDALTAWKDTSRWFERKQNQSTLDTLVLDLNFPPEIINEINHYGQFKSYDRCPFNIFLVDEIFPSSEELVENILSFAKQFQDTYYPFLRFLICSKLGISTRFFDNAFAQILKKDSRLRRHIWLYASKGIETTEHIIRPELIRTLGRFFDRIAYRK